MILRLAGGWTVFVWVVFLRNLLFRNNDNSVGFKVVHTVLAVVSLGFAGAIFVVASRSRQRTSERTGTR